MRLAGLFLRQVGFRFSTVKFLRHRLAILFVEEVAKRKDIILPLNVLMSISVGLGPSIFCRQMEKTRLMREEMDGNVFIYHQSWHSHFDFLVICILFPICTLTWRLNNYVSREGKDINRRNESTEEHKQLY